VSSCPRNFNRHPPGPSCCPPTSTRCHSQERVPAAHPSRYLPDSAASPHGSHHRLQSNDQTRSQQMVGAELGPGHFKPSDRILSVRDSTKAPWRACHGGKHCTVLQHCPHGDTLRCWKGAQTLTTCLKDRVSCSQADR